MPLLQNRNYQERTSKSVRTYIRWILEKLNNQSEFKATEIKRIQRLLHLSDAERDHIFLPRIVIENHQKVKKEVMTMSFWNDEKKKEFKRQYEEYCSGSMGPEDKKRFEKLLVLLAVHDFQNKNSLPIYLLWGCLLALLVDAVYKAVIGGDWITPLGCLIGVVGFGTLLFLSLVLLRIKHLSTMRLINLGNT